MSDGEKKIVELLREIDRKLVSIMRVQDAQFARLDEMQSRLDVLVPPPEGSVSKYRR